MSTYASTASNTTTSKSTASAAPISSDESLVYHVDLFLIALVALYALARLPRAIALFGTTREWIDGHFLHRGPVRPTHRRISPDTGAYPLKESPTGSPSDDTHNPYPYAFNASNEKWRASALRLPPHAAACPRVLRPLMTPLRVRIAPGFSVAQFLVLSVYFISLLYAGFFRANIFTDGTRTGWVAAAQLPFVFAFAQKNNIVGAILGYGYEKLNFLHRFAGRMVLIASNVHALHWFYQWSLNGTVALNLKNPSNVWGIVALASVDLIFVFSTEYWRGKAYNLFLSTHILGFTLILPAVYLHRASMLTFVLASVAFFAADHLFRLLKSRVATAHLRPLPELEATRVVIPALNAGWRAGQHIRLRVLSTALGRAAWLEAHPFTIANVSRSEEGMVLMVKKAGGWTRQMFEVAKMAGYTEGGLGREVKVVVEGPYGGPQRTVLSSFSGVVLVAGGSGITFALAALEDLVQKDTAGESRVKIIELVWVVADPSSLGPLLPRFTALLQQSVYTPLRISVFYTRAPTGKQPAFFDRASAPPVSEAPLITAPVRPARPPPLDLGESEAALLRRPGERTTAPPRRTGSRSAALVRAGTGNSTSPTAATPLARAPSASGPGALPAGLTLAPGRPRLIKFVEHALARAVVLGGNGALRAKDESARALAGLAVAVCGPREMSDDAAAAVGGVDALRAAQVGGVELVEEVFGW